MTAPAETVRALQERTALAHPALHAEVRNGWWLRHAPGCPWWTRSVLPHGGSGDLASDVEDAERFCIERGFAPGFQISPGVCPADLDALLAGRGYRRTGLMSLQMAPSDEVASRLAVSAWEPIVEGQLTRPWFDVWYSMHGDGGDRSALERMLRSVDRSSAYVGVRRGGRIVAVGRGVADGDWAGVFGMATVPSARRQGAAGEVLASLARWAVTAGVPNLYLQVEAGNAGARRLYGRAGFREVCAYHYRTLD
ncbi:MAG: GNAT family N-acetyltransferase [Actinomycetota bacterium]